MRPWICQGPWSAGVSGRGETGLVGTVPDVISAVQHRHGYRCPVAYWIMKAIISPFLYLLWRVRVEGREHVPADGPVILAANHQSFCDSFFLPLVVRRRVTYVAKAEYFDSWKTAWFFRAAGQIPMNRSGGDASQRALDTATEVLRSGGVLAIYPEGTRAPGHPAPQGQDRRGPAGPGLRRAGRPGRPRGHPRRSSPPGSMVMRPFHSVTVRFGPPVAYDRAATAGDHRQRPSGRRQPVRRRPADQEELRALTDALMADIAGLSGQEYVDEYASRRREPARRATRRPRSPSPWPTA